MDKIYINADFYAKWVVDEDVSADTITIEYTKPNGAVTAGVAPTSVTENVIRYDVPKAQNTLSGTWKLQAKVVRGGLTYFTQTIFIVIHERFT